VVVCTVWKGALVKHPWTRAELRGERGRVKWGPIDNRRWRWWGEDNVHLSFPLGYKLAYFSSLFLVESSAFGFTNLWAQHLYRVVVGFRNVPYWFLFFFFVWL